MTEQIPKSNGPLIEAVAASVHRIRSRGASVKDINWQMAAGEYWVVGAPHGSGKTAFLATVAGLRPPAAGVIRHFGQDLSTLTEDETIAYRLRVGFVFKNGGRMFTQLTVAESVALPLRYHRDWTDEKIASTVEALLEATDLAPLSAVVAQDLSTGWQERVGLARALALEPEVLFLDEPMAGLEGGHRHWWLHFLDQLSRGSGWANGRKMTLIAATSDFSYWSGERRRFGLLADGRWQPLDSTEAPNLNELVRTNS